VKSFFALIVLSVLLLSNIPLFGQKPLNPAKDLGPKTKIELIHADSLVGIKDLSQTETFYGRVVFKHNGVVLACDRATQNNFSNTIEAFGHIKIIQGDTLTISGDTLFYEGNIRFARIYGNKVILKDRNVVLTTTKMNYDLLRNQVYYPVYGLINQDKSKLSSNEGYYNTRTKIFNYRGNVKIDNPDFKLNTDTLDYDSNTKWTYFKSPTTINSKDGILKSSNGKYNTKTRISVFSGRSKVNNEKYSLEADTLNFNNITESGTATGKVIFVSKEDSLILTGNRGLRDGKLGFTKMFGDAIMQKFENKDTLLLAATNIFAFEKKDTLVKKVEKKEIQKLYAFGNVKLFRKDFQSVCDSLFYNFSDSLIKFVRNPVIWSNENQLEADTITSYLSNRKIKSIFLDNKSFIVAQDTALNYNQIKGRKISALFDKNTAIELVNVDGNGESIYFALDEKNKLIGLNRVECSKMRMNFKDKKVKRIAFLGKPESQLIPPNSVGKNELTLENFKWKAELRPNEKTINPPKTNSEAVNETVLKSKK
jgi:lipopolysaccharide export system protein LptA